MGEPTVLSVAQYLDSVNTILRDEAPKDVLVEGEISDFRISQNKWVSFDLKDEEEQAVLKCFMTTWQMVTPLEAGMRVRVAGYAKIYERFGTFKLNVTQADPVGEGALRRAYELLKKKLETEGLFDVTRKRTLPRFVQRIGLITSREAAAYGDFLRILNNRWGGVEVVHAHVHVQGKNAVPEILQAFEGMNALSEPPDVIVLVRGGGGLEDLHAFNDEQVARAVFQSKVPVVVGVGHERDESLCDYVADIRASTPSNAAERIVPSREEVHYELEMSVNRMEERITHELDQRRRVIDLAARAIGELVERQQERLRVLHESLIYRMDRWLPYLRETIEGREKLLAQIDPKRVLARGYSLVTVGGKVLKDASMASVGAELQVQLAKGTLDAEVVRVNGKGQNKLL